jgi:hypothetical protein
MKGLTVHIGPLLAVVVLATPMLRAESLPVAPVSWSYQNPDNVAIYDLDNGARAGLTLQNSQPTTVTDSQDISAAKIIQWSIADPATADVVNNQSYRFKLKLLDIASNVSGIAEFTGILSGAIWATGTSLTNTFTGETSQMLTLGDNKYLIELTGFTAPNISGLDGFGQFLARVTVNPAAPPPPPPPPPPPDPDPPITDAPEPGTLTLVGLGLPLVGAVQAWRRRRQRG